MYYGHQKDQGIPGRWWTRANKEATNLGNKRMSARDDKQVKVHSGVKGQREKGSMVREQNDLGQMPWFKQSLQEVSGRP